MKKFEIRLTGDSQFSHGVIAAGSLVATISMHEPIEPTSLLSMIQFGQASMSAIFDKEEFQPESDLESFESVEEQPDTTLDGIDSEDNVEDPDQSEPVVGDLVDLLDESLVDSLAANKITTKQELFAFLKTGKDLVDLEKIGPTRAKKILAAIASMQEDQQ
jgi:hypothetical protein